MNSKKQNVRNENEQQMTSPTGRLICIGRNKGYVSFNDILQVIPHPENHMQYLELIFATLLAANIPIIDENE